MFCVNTFWFRNTDTSPGKEEGEHLPKEKQGSAGLAGAWTPELGLLHHGVESWTRPITEPCQMGLDGERLS